MLKKIFWAGIGLFSVCMLITAFNNQSIQAPSWLSLAVLSISEMDD
jgi:hypothetical protein